MGLDETNRSISRDEALELTRAEGWTEDAELGAAFSPIARFYSHPDGRVLAVPHEGDLPAMLYSDGDAIRKRAREALKLNDAGRGKHVLAGRLPGEDRFAVEVPTFVARLSTSINVPSDRLNNTVESLRFVDESLHPRGMKDIVDTPLFAQLVAYVGEVLVSFTNGRWEMTLADDGSTWEPLVISAKAETFSPGVIVFDALYKKRTLWTSVIGTLGAYGYGRNR